MAPARRKAVRRPINGQKQRKKPLPQGGVGNRTRDSSSSSGSSRSSDEDDDSSSSDCECSDEDDPRDYKRGGYHPVMPYQLYNARYRVLSKLGAGAFSTVWLCADEKTAAERPDGLELVAMKVCKSKKSVTEQALDEILLLEQLQKSTQPEHVVQMRGHFWHSGPYGRHKCMVFEVMGENLLSLVKYHDYDGLPMNMVRRLAQHTLRGLEYIHARGVIHTDVKLENVLVQRHDLADLMLEARRAHRAFMEQKQDMANLSKSQKKRAKKKAAKNMNRPQEEEKEDAEAAEDTTEAVGNSGAAVEEDPDVAAAQACGRPVPPVRQRDRFETLETEKVFAKLADFGNGCLADRKITDEIQTRQYRSPEVILGASWNETADVWSAACMFFELITGDFLFDPRTGKDWSRDEDHLALMIELIGGHPPKEWALSGKYSKDFFSPLGKLKHIGKLKFWSLKDVLKEKYALKDEKAEEVASFLLPMLTWEPSKRISAKEALEHPWLLKWDEEEEEDDDEEDDDATETEEAEDAEDVEDDEERKDAAAKWTPKEAETPTVVEKKSAEEIPAAVPAATATSQEAAHAVPTAVEPVPAAAEPVLAAEPVPAAAEPLPATAKSKALRKGKGIGGVPPPVDSKEATRDAVVVENGQETVPSLVAVAKEQKEEVEETDGVAAAAAAASTVAAAEIIAAETKAEEPEGDEDEEEEAPGVNATKKKKRKNKKGKK